MEHVTPFDWHRLFLGDEPALFFAEIAFRVVAVYVFAVLLVRMMGRRGYRGLSPFESVVIIALGSAAGDTMFYPQVLLLYAFVVIALVVGLDRVFAGLQVRSKAVNSFIEGDPLLVVSGGRIDYDAVRRASMRPDELLAMLREQGIDNVGELRFAFIERTGGLGFIRYTKGEWRPGERTFPADLSGESG